jgi:hypothetical protein
MNKDQEDELLMHVAAGTDLLTAISALPDDSDAEDEQPLATSESSSSGIVWAVLLFIAMVVVTMWML